MSSYGQQHLLSRARWHADAVRDDCRGFVVEHLHHEDAWTARHRWVTLAMLAHAFLTVVRADEHARHPKPDGLIPLTCNEIQHLFAALAIRPVHDATHRLAACDWWAPSRTCPVLP